jgi:hypothetical protein
MYGSLAEDARRWDRAPAEAGPLPEVWHPVSLDARGAGALRRETAVGSTVRSAANALALSAAAPKPRLSCFVPFFEDCRKKCPEMSGFGPPAARKPPAETPTSIL